MNKQTDNPDKTRMPFTSHLDELRNHLVRSLLVLFGLFLVGWTLFREQLETLFTAPHRRAVAALKEQGLDFEPALKVFDPLEAIFFDMKVSAVAALIFGLPYLLYQIWSFVASGLHPKERKVVSNYIPAGMLFAMVGVCFGYFFMYPMLLQFLYGMVNFEIMDPDYRLASYFSAFLMFTLSLALVFQLPLIILALGSAGIVDAPTLRKYRRHFILGAFVIGAMLTPPDPMSQLMMAVPTLLLYELGIVLVVMRGKDKTLSANDD